MMLAPAVSVYEPQGLLHELSNYSAAGFFLDGRHWPSVEHYFQAAKFLSTSVRDEIAAAPTPQDAKHLAWTRFLPHVRADWEAVREAAMLRALEAKCSQVPSFRQQLWECWPWPIYEDSEHDDVWGIGPRAEGRNLLGRCLEAVRRTLVGNPDVIFASFGARPVHRSESGYALIDWAQVRVDASVRELRPSDLAAGRLVAVSIDTVMEADLAARRLGIGSGIQSLGAVSFGDALDWLRRHNPGADAGELAEALSEARSLAFTTKYLDYRWEEDIRSVIPGWTERFFAAVGHVFDETAAGGILVIGGGAGGEAARLWNKFGSRVTFADVSTPMVNMALAQAPLAAGVAAAAEDLEPLPDGRFDVYVSLRAYQSFLFDTRRALKEANRVLAADGRLLISISDGYLNAEGKPIRGRITGQGRFSTGDCARDVVALVALLPAYGFEPTGIVNLGSEICLMARKSSGVEAVGWASICPA